MRSTRLLALVLTLGLLPRPAFAQAYQCTPPRTLSPVKPVKPDGPVRKLPVAGYTLAASWSPDWCKMSGDSASMQCSRRNGRFGFVLHGLWPQAARGPAPQWCGGGSQPQPSPDLLRKHLCMTPSASLLAREWAKHGTCMTSRPQTYFNVSSILWRSIRWPDADALSRQDNLTAHDFREAFMALNKDWPGSAIGIAASRSGWLREVHLCYGRDFMPRACSPYQFGLPDKAALKIWRGL